MEIEEVKFNLKVMKAEFHLVSHVFKNMKFGELTEDWYVGITGQKDDDGDGRVDRINGHKQMFPKMNEDTWEEYSIDEDDDKKREGIAKQVEINMKKLGFDTGTKIQSGNLPIKIVYTFKKGTKDLRNQV